MHGGVPQPVASTKPLKSDWAVFERSQKDFKKRSTIREQQLMQGSLPQPILPIENKTSDRVVSEKNQEVSKNGLKI